MTLTLNDEQGMIREAAKRFLEEKSGASQHRVLRDSDDETGFSSALWGEMVAMGWPGIAIGAPFGGSGFGYVGLGLILEQAGRNLTASPLQSAILCGATLVRELGTAAQKAALLPAIASGDRLLTLALEEGAHHAPRAVALSARREGDGYILDGRKTFVLDAHVADLFVVIARSSGCAGETDGMSAFLVDASSEGVTVQRHRLVDARNVGMLRLDQARVPASALLGDEGMAWAGLERTLDIANIGLAAELLGICDRAFDITLGYLKERRQFERTIGSFQALQHRAAQLFVELELARSVVLQALRAIDDGADDLSLHASAAKAKLCEVAERVTNEAIQMHGGIGVTDEHDIGFYLKRSRAAMQYLGDHSYHLDRFANLRGF